MCNLLHMLPFLNLCASVYYALEEYILKIRNIITNLPKIANVKRIQFSYISFVSCLR